MKIIKSMSGPTTFRVPAIKKDKTQINQAIYIKISVTESSGV